MSSILLALLVQSSAWAGLSLTDTGFQSIDGASLTLKGLLSSDGKAVLLVNIATRCGYSPQLKDLEALANKYKGQGLVVLGVPSNDFGGQSPEKPRALKKFCRLTYGVNFPLSQKMKVSGPDKSLLMARVLNQEAKPSEIQWNFEKFLLNKNGKLLKRWSSKEEVLGGDIESGVMKVLTETANKIEKK